jgi:hypothetical protein
MVRKNQKDNGKGMDCLKIAVDLVPGNQQYLP